MRITLYTQRMMKICTLGSSVIGYEKTSGLFILIIESFQLVKIFGEPEGEMFYSENRVLSF